MWPIIPGLFLGDREDARDEARLLREGITHVVNCAGELPCYFDGRFVYLWLKLKDPDDSFAAEIPRFCEFIDDGRRAGNVLVHCTAGVSRSPAVVLAYLCHLGEPLEKAAEQLSQAVQTGIDEVFLRQLAKYTGIETTVSDLNRLSLKLLGRS